MTTHVMFINKGTCPVVIATPAEAEAGKGYILTPGRFIEKCLYEGNDYGVAELKLELPVDTPVGG
jgi:hypothetical protein